MNATDKRISEQGNIFDASLIRDLIVAALDHDAASDAVTDLLFEHVAGGRYHPLVVTSRTARRPLIAGRKSTLGALRVLLQLRPITTATAPDEGGDTRRGRAAPISPAPPLLEVGQSSWVRVFQYRIARGLTPIVCPSSGSLTCRTVPSRRACSKAAVHSFNSISSRIVRVPIR